MSKLSERLKELMDEKGIGIKEMAKSLGLLSASAIYMWKNNYRGISVDNAVKLADLFNCSVDYLVGRSDDYGDSDNYGSISFKSCPPFGRQLKKILGIYKSSQNRLVKFANISTHTLNNWFNYKGVPNVETVTRIADLLDITIDELIGRTP